MGMWNIGSSTCERRSIPENLFEEYAKAGLECMEISLAHPEDRDDIDGEYNLHTSLDIKKLKKGAEANGIDIWSYHLPFGHPYFNLSCVEKDKRDYTISKHSELIKRAAEMGAKVVVVHPGAGAGIIDGNREESIKISCDTISHLVKTAKECGITLALENLPRESLGRTGSEMLKLLEVDDALGVCFDVNHLLIESHRDFVKSVGNKIATLHISDYDFVNERHWLPGKGKIDWNELIQLLKGINYKGPFMNEVGARTSNENGDRPTYGELCKINKELLEKYF